MTEILRPVAGTISLLLLGSLPAFAYSNLGNGVYQTDGSAADTQAAMNAVPSGSTVQIPNGSYSWSTSVSNGSNFVHLMGQSKGGVTITSTQGTTDMMQMSQSAAGNVEVANITFNWPYSSHYPLTLNGSTGKPTLVHDCNFHTGFTYAITCWTNGHVIYNCTFDGSYTGGANNISGVQSYGVFGDWAQPSTIGKLDSTGTRNTYVEDCTFNQCALAGTNADDNCRIVWRHNTLNDSSLNTHGQETSDFGIRQFEAYNNTFTLTNGNPYNMNYWIQIRGGTGVITGNAMPLVSGKTTVELNVYGIRRNVACVSGSQPAGTVNNGQTNKTGLGWVGYPYPRQPGMGWNGTGPYTYNNVPHNDVTASWGGPQYADGSGYFIDPIYMWNNTGGGSTSIGAVNDSQGDVDGNGQDVSTYLQANRDYFLNVAHPTWAPYTYPHPLRNGSGSSAPEATPVAPQNLRIAS